MRFPLLSNLDANVVSERVVVASLKPAQQDHKNSEVNEKNETPNEGLISRISFSDKEVYLPTEES